MNKHAVEIVKDLRIDLDGDDIFISFKVNKMPNTFFIRIKKSTNLIKDDIISAINYEIDKELVAIKVKKEICEMYKK